MEYLSPGVYVEEVDAGPRPIEGVSTSTAGFVGVTRRGPETPQLITSYPDFARVYGGPLEPQASLVEAAVETGRTGLLARAARGFFENGGQRLFVQRVLAADSAAARFQVRDVITTRVVSVPDLRVVEVASVYGIAIDGTLRFETEGSVAIERTVTGIDAERRRVTLSPLEAPVAGLDASRTVVVVSPLGVAPVVELRARARGEWGNSLSAFARTEYGARTQMTAPFSVTLLPLGASLVLRSLTSATEVELDRLGASVDLEGHVIALSDGTRTHRRTVRAQDDTGTATDETTTLTVDALPTGFTPTSIEDLTVLFVAGPATPGDVSGQRVNVPIGFVEPTSANRFAAGERLLVAGGGGPRTSATFVSNTAGSIELTVHDVPPEGLTFLRGATLTHEVLSARSGVDSITVASTRQFYPGALVQLARRNDSGAEVHREYRYVDEIAGNELVLDGSTGSSFNQGDFVTLCEHALTVRYVNEEDGAREEESFQGLSLDRETDRFIETVVNARSRLVEVVSVAPAGSAPPGFGTLTGAFADFFDGTNGSAVTAHDFAGEDLGPGRRSGIQAFNAVDEVSLVAAPGIWSQSVQNALITHCELLADRFAVLDAPLDATVLQAQDHRNLFDSQYAALYCPWLTVSTREGSLALPPSGHVVGLYARTDVERGVWKAPANVVVRGITGLRQTITKREHDILNADPTNVNVIRDFRAQGRSFRVWGARCVTSDSPWKYVPVRRLFLFLEESIENGTQWAVFEPNDQRLWARLRQSVTGFLTTQWRNGALMGATPDEAFFVVCDRRTMTQDDIENGRLIMRIGVAPVRPAEFVVIRISQWDGGSSIEELLNT